MCRKYLEIGLRKLVRWIVPLRIKQINDDLNRMSLLIEDYKLYNEQWFIDEMDKLNAFSVKY